MSIDLEPLRKVVGQAPAPTQTTKLSSKGISMGGQIGYAIQIIGRSILGSLAWLFFSSFMKAKGAGWFVNDFWTFFILVGFCFVSDTYIPFLSPFQRDLVLGVIAEPFFKWVLQFTK